MRLGVGRVDKLTGDEAARNRGCQLVGLGNGALHALGALGQHQLRAIGLHQLAALHAHGVRHDDDDTIAPGSRHGGKADARIAGGRLDDDGAGLQQTLFLGVVDHGLGHPVFHGTGGVQILQLCQNFRLQAKGFFNVGQLQQGRFADELVGRSVNVCHDYPSFTASKPRCKSARMSSMCSVPMDSRMVLGLMP